MRVARSCYYEWLNRPLSKQQEEDLVLGEEVKKSFKESRCTYGHRRIKKELRGKGFKTSNDRVRRLMKELNLVPVQARKFKATTNSNGAGKTTAIRALAGLISIEGGEITLFGETQAVNKLHLKQNLGLVTQEVTVLRINGRRKSAVFWWFIRTAWSAT